eukprot:gb/GECG01002415.1/.p1 GENE.gb/GECG01002415.1/~~gb/GECG01002415.1/.p1  ORF type:complete len:598 (+),score=44.62 gb/GECG01002415.1/:1-1794(+)
MPAYRNIVAFPRRSLLKRCGRTSLPFTGDYRGCSAPLFLHSPPNHRSFASKSFRFGPDGALIVDEQDAAAEAGEVEALHKFYKFQHADRPRLFDHDFMYDLIVVGGGSGGLASAREAAKHGAKVALVNYVFSSPLHGTRNNSNTGLGGTCVNMGCIPKLLAHHGSLLGESFRDSEYYGWRETPRATHDWYTMIKNIQNVRQGSNFSYKSVLQEEGVDYLNAMASFVDEHTLQLAGEISSYETAHLTSRYFVLCPGGYPRLPDIPGIELCITSDDIFSLPDRPGKTVVVGGGYIALECAGFLSKLGYDVTILLRSIPLRGFDREYSEKVLRHLEQYGVKVIRGAVPASITQDESGQKVLEWFDMENTTTPDEKEHKIPCDTVLMAIGRDARTSTLSLGSSGVNVCPNTHKIVVNPGNSQTSKDHIFAVGDAALGKPELTPLAIKEGTSVSQRLLGHSCPKSYVVPTTVFTPQEYSCIGLSEEAARGQYGEENIEVFHTNFTPTEWAPLLHRPSNSCSCKAIVQKSDAGFIDGKVVGLHYFGPHAGEVMQGFTTAMQMGMRFSDLRGTIGIHPTSAEEFVDLSTTKSSGDSPDKKTCCG